METNIESILKLMYIRLNGLIRMENTVHPSSEEKYYLSGQIYELELAIKRIENIMKI